MAHSRSPCLFLVFSGRKLEWQQTTEPMKTEYRTIEIAVVWVYYRQRHMLLLMLENYT